jgi:simple sugar transport system permease protein
MGVWKRFSRSKILWPLLTLAILLLFNLFFTPHFFRIEMLEGHLFGNLIDILKNGAPIMILAIGLTLVIATHGIDISVGSVIWLYVKPFALLGQGYLFGLPFSLYIVAFLLLVTYLVTRRTALGMFIEAVGINPTATRFAGINARGILFW